MFIIVSPAVFHGWYVRQSFVLNKYSSLSIHRLDNDLGYSPDKNINIVQEVLDMVNKGLIWQPKK